jgi:hypothetical protein
MAQYAHVPASPEWYPALSNQHRGNILSHSKRKADDELESQSHISSQFKKLRLNQNLHSVNGANNVSHVTNFANITPAQTHHYPVPPAPSTPATTSKRQHVAQSVSPTISFRPHIANTDARPALAPAHAAVGQHEFAHPPSSPHPPNSLPHAAHRATDEDYMPVDDTPHRIIIHDLDNEIAQIEAEEASHAQSLFLPEIDKKVSGDIAHHLLQRGGGQNHDRNQHHMHMNVPHLSLDKPPENFSTALILYREPSSISVPEEEDVVRKTIIEARKRAREKSAEEQKQRERLAIERDAMLTTHPTYWEDRMVDDSPQHTRVGEGMLDEDLDGDPMDIE